MGLFIQKKMGETTYITLPSGELIEIRYERNQGKDIVLHFTSPRSVQIDRQVLWDRKQQEVRKY